MNKTVMKMFYILILVCGALTIAAFSWNSRNGNSTGYLELKNEKEPDVEIEQQPQIKEKVKENLDKLDIDYAIDMEVFFSYLLLNSTFIPISLLVTIEIVKVWHAYFMKMDHEMYSE